MVTYSMNEASEWIRPFHSVAKHSHTHLHLWTKKVSSQMDRMQWSRWVHKCHSFSWPDSAIIYFGLNWWIICRQRIMQIDVNHHQAAFLMSFTSFTCNSYSRITFDAHRLHSHPQLRRDRRRQCWVGCFGICIRNRLEFFASKLVKSPAKS